MKLNPTAAVLFAVTFGSLPAFAAWDCRTLNDKDSKSTETGEKVRTLCEGLANAGDFWVSGHEGHFPAKDRTPGYATMTRMLCTNGGTQDLAVGAVQGTSLELFCLSKSQRNSGTAAVDALNAVFTKAGANDKQVTWISSDDASTQNFYKSLNVSCACDEKGPAGKGQAVRFMTFAASKHPIQKKEQHFTESQKPFVRRILFDSCMSETEFEHISTELIANEVAIEKQAFHQADKPVLLSEVVGNLPGLDKNWKKEHPTSCK